jgi:hypothetical protein
MTYLQSISPCARPQTPSQARTARMASCGPLPAVAVRATSPDGSNNASHPPCRCDGLSVARHFYSVRSHGAQVASSAAQIQTTNAASPRISIFVSLRLGRGCSWVRVYRLHQRALLKAPVQSDGLPTIWPVTYFLKSPEHFGRQKQRSMSPRVRRARCARLNAISLATANGRATRSPPSSLKSSNVIQCGM